MERDQLLRSIVAQVRVDERTSSVWVISSLGRGDSDALSDIDLLIVADEELLQAIIAERHAFAEKLGKTLFFLEAPQNAPKNGAYLMGCYDAPTAPHLVDFYWQSTPQPWDSSPPRLLFERMSTNSSHNYSVPFQQKSFSDLKGSGLPHDVRYFWMMFFIVAKYICRKPFDEKVHLLDYLTQAYESARCMVEGSPALDAYILDQAVDAPAQKLALLSYLADQMAGVMAYLPDQDAEGILPAADRYLAMVEGAIL
jgi:predicted nucleotidyltransferase